MIGGDLLLSLALAIVVPILGYFAKVRMWVLIVSGVSAAAGSIYFLKERSRKAESFNRLTLVLIIAVSILAWAKKIPVPGFLPLSLAVLSTPFLDISYMGKKFLSIPFWIFTYWGVSDIFSLRYSGWGYLIGGVVALIAWRDLFGKVQKTQ